MLKKIEFTNELMPRGGPIHEGLLAWLSLSYEPFQFYRAGLYDNTEYSEKLEEDLERFVSFGIRPNDLCFTLRYPKNEAKFVNACMLKLKKLKILEKISYSEFEYEESKKKIDTLWDFQGMITYIAPEEARLLFAISQSLAPKRAVFLGSYFGYWAAFAIFAILQSGGTVFLVDTNESMNAIALENLHRFGFVNNFKVHTLDACEFLNTTDEQFDLAVLDAELPDDYPDQSIAGKRIYRRILDAAIPKIREGGLLVAHNILSGQPIECSALSSCVEKTASELSSFRALADRKLHAELPTTEGVGVYRF